MCFKISLSFLLILLISASYPTQGQNFTDANTTVTSVVETAATATSSETSISTVLSCSGGHIDPPNCTKCAPNYENKDDKCFEIKSQLKPSRDNGRRIFLIVLTCLLTVFLVLAMLGVYGRVTQQRRRRSSPNPGTISNSSNFNTNIRNRFNNILRSIGLNNLNRRGRFNFFSISNNNNNSSGQYRQPDSSRAQLSENPDEALLFDDPYADGGFNNSSANPYKSLTLAIT